MDYFILLEKLMSSLTCSKDYDIERIYDVLKQLGKIFRISKGVTTFYDNPEQERLKKGEEFVCYDNGNSSDITHIKRVTNVVGTIGICEVYLENGAEPWSEEELVHIELILGIILGYMSNYRLARLVEKLSYHDSLGYPNLQYFIREIEKRNLENKLIGNAAIYFNLFHFVQINQQLGRAAGDGVMKRYIDLLNNIIDDTGPVCRIGGDNFGMFCHVGSLPEVIKVFEQAKIVFDINSGDTIQVSATAGIFVVPEDFKYTNTGDIMEKIICGYKEAKVGGGSRIVYYDESMLRQKGHTMWVQSQFGAALKNKEFKVFYQPKVDVLTGEIKGAEALCRWFHKDKLIQPSDFIPVLEQTTDICKLDFYMLDQVCLDIKRWLEEKIDVVRISVNLSRKHLLDLELVEHILEVVDSHRIPHEYIEIELTETTSDVEFRDLKRIVNGLKEAGITISVDDFGIGYSSLNLIRDIPWDVIKIDKSFLPTDDESADSIKNIMFRNVLSMANEMGLESVTEGVETKMQLELLRLNCCDLAQGFLFDHPLPVEEFEKKLESPKYVVN